MKQRGFFGVVTSTIAGLLGLRPQRDPAAVDTDHVEFLAQLQQALATARRWRITIDSYVHGEVIYTIVVNEKVCDHLRSARRNEP